MTVRSRSTVTLLKGGKVQCGGGALSRRPDQSKKTPAYCDSKEETRAGTGPGLESTPPRVSARSARRLEGTLKVAESKGERESNPRHVPLESEGCQRTPLLRNKKRYPGEHKKPLSTWCEQTPRRKNGQREKPLASGAAASRSVASSLMQAEDWLANNEEEIEVGPQRRRRGSGQTDRVRKSETRGRRALDTSLASRDDQLNVQRVQSDRGVVGQELSGASVRLRGKAAAVLAAMKLQQKEEEEMTGTPEITRLGQSKHRSIDDLFLFQRNIDASRRHKQYERDTKEESLVTGRPVRTR